MIYFNDFELILLIAIISISFALFLSYRIYAYCIYKQRKITYPLFWARDKLIRCVATNAISEKDPLFLFFYQSSIDLINAVHTDFFSLSNFIKSIRKIENDKHFAKQRKKLINDIKSKEPQFQEAVSSLITASQYILIEKNLLLKVILHFIFKSFLLKKAMTNFFNKFKKFKDIVDSKAYYQDYKNLQEFIEAV